MCFGTATLLAALAGICAEQQALQGAPLFAQNSTAAGVVSQLLPSLSESLDTVMFALPYVYAVEGLTAVRGYYVASVGITVFLFTAFFSFGLLTQKFDVLDLPNQTADDSLPRIIWVAFMTVYFVALFFPAFCEFRLAEPCPYCQRERWLALLSMLVFYLESVLLPLANNWEIYNVVAASTYATVLLMLAYKYLWVGDQICVSHRSSRSLLLFISFLGVAVPTLLGQMVTGFLAQAREAETANAQTVYKLLVVAGWCAITGGIAAIWKGAIN